MGLSTGVQTAIGKFVWHDHISTDVEKAKSFYSELFGWETEVWKPGEQDYPMIKAGGQMHGGFGPAEGGAPAHWLGHVLVEDVDETVRRAEGAGAKILAEPSELPEVGRVSVFADPQGAVVSAYSPAGDVPESEGVFVWDELHTSDIQAAKSFYTEVFGWTTRDTDMGEMGTYVIFQRAGDVDAAGGMQLPKGMAAPPHWLAYIGTDDVDRTTARAKELGGTILQEPMDIPDIGRFSIIQDPTGATVGIYKPS
jgi:predicted enzyme related to lactoylglutathione lyase